MPGYTRILFRLSQACVCLMLCWPIYVDAQMLSLGNKKRETILFKSVKNLIIVPLYINGKGPYNFVLDTGVGIFLITDPSLIDSLALTNLRTITMNGFGEGKDLSAYISPSLKVDIGHNITGTIAAGILKKDAFDLSAYAGMPVHGLIGYEFFNSFIVRVDYVLNELTVFRPETEFILRKGIKIPIDIEERKPYVLSEVVISPKQKILAKLIIDTGAGHPLSLETNDGAPFVSLQNIPANLGVGLSGIIKGYISRISSINLGKFELKNVIAAFPDYNDVAAKVLSVKRNGNIGNNILKRFIVVFDYSRQAMYLRPSIKYKEPFEHDMSGMELLAQGKEYDHFIVSRVEKNSAAYDIGLSEGDELISINFKRASEMNMEEIDGIFRSKDGRNLILDVLLNGTKEIQRVVMTLKRRI